MNERWSWILRYLVVIAAALILAAAFGEMTLFKTTRFGKTGLNAARQQPQDQKRPAVAEELDQARRAATLMPSHDARWNVMKNTLVPLVTLIVVSVGQAVILLLLGPLMNKAWHQFYSWVSIAAIILSAAWLLGAVLTGSASLAPLFGGRIARRQPRVGHEV
jgi:hypothetical protein